MDQSQTLGAKERIHMIPLYEALKQAKPLSSERKHVAAAWGRGGVGGELQKVGVFLGGWKCSVSSWIEV